MQNFFAFIIRHSTFFFFLLLEGICAALVLNFNGYHRSAFLSSSNAIHGSIYSVTSSVSHYFGLADANEDLIRQNVALMATIDSLKHQIDANAAALAISADSLHPVASLCEPSVHYRVAHVINAMTNRSRNMLTLDAGLADGVDRDMAVANAEGVVGLVVSASNHYSLVLPVINTASRLSVKLADSNHRGQLLWDGFSPRHATVVDIPEHAHVEIGDSIVTSGASSFFPEGLLVGTVDAIEPDKNGGFFRLDVDLAVDFNSVYAVSVIDNPTADERLQLESSELQ